MPFAIELLLDAASAGVVRAGWQRMASEQLGFALDATPAQPHVTLAVADDADLPALEALVAETAASIPPTPVLFSSIGVFLGETGVVCLAPVGTERLLRIHRAFHSGFLGSVRSAWPYYAPDRWVPHCTVAMDVARAQLSDAVAATVAAVPVPLSGTLDRISVVEFRPTHEHAVFALSGGNTADVVP